MPLPLSLNMMTNPQKKPPLNQAALAQALPGKGAQMFGLQGAPTPGLPQPTSTAAPGGAGGVGQAGFTQMPGQEDPGNQPGSDKDAAFVTFGFGDHLTTPQLQALQKAIIDARVGQQQTNEQFQDRRVKKIGSPPRTLMPQQSGSTTPYPVQQSSPNDPWTTPSSR